MSLSVYKSRTGAVWPLGAIVVATAGTPVCIMANVDANNTNAPENPSNSSTSEYTPTARGLGIQGFHPGANNNGMVINSGNIYLMLRAAGGNGNRTDSGAMVKVITPGTDLFYPIDPTGGLRFSPYSYFIDADNNNDGGLCVLYQGMNP